MSNNGLIMAGHALITLFPERTGTNEDKQAEEKECSKHVDKTVPGYDTQKEK